MLTRAEKERCAELGLDLDLLPLTPAAREEVFESVAAEIDPSTTVLNDKESLTPDPLAPNSAYAIWDRLVSPSINANPSAFTFSPAFRGPVMFSNATKG